MSVSFDFYGLCGKCKEPRALAEVRALKQQVKFWLCRKCLSELQAMLPATTEKEEA